MNEKRIIKLSTHEYNYAKDDIIISQKDFPNVKIGDVVEVYSIEDNYSRLLLHVTNITDKPKFISIEHALAMSFQLRKFGDVIVNFVKPEDVVLDSVELFFKDQYIARSDMWLLKKSITNTCVYLNKKVEFCNVRCQVFEIWSQGARMASGYINEQTKVVFRSASSMVYLFVQMSSEMWDYDINGDLYFEKAVNGFLADLFNKWKTFNCCHDVSIVFFSRTYYQATHLNEFPESMRECLQVDTKSGRFYEDYYRVAIQNERYDDWSPILVKLKKLFNLYEKDVVHYHQKKGVKVPNAYNSTASQGNFLEVLNISLNIFERHNLDRSFDRTGQLSVVISPGVGVYEVDLDLTNLTKQRIIDNGIGSDLVCLGEQPLHAVPLFKFNHGYPDMLNDEYNMPHWINLSFYSSKQRFSSNFVPRIKMPNILQIKPALPKRSSLNLPTLSTDNYSNGNGSDMSCQHIPTFIDFDEYDNQIFKTSTSSESKQTIQASQIKKNTFVHPMNVVEKTINHLQPQEPMSKRRLSEVVPASFDYHNQTPPNSPVNADAIDGISMLYDRHQSHPQLSTSVENRSFKEHKFKLKAKDDIKIHHSKNETHRTKALINPFDPSNVTIKLNSNRRRWTHVFPLGPTGIFMQQHHYQAMPQNGDDVSTLRRTSVDQVDFGFSNQSSQPIYKRSFKSRSNLDSLSKRASLTEQFDPHQKTRSSLLTDNSSLWAWGATGELEWTSAITTGVDWKSLVMPACLPITTDFLPDKQTLRQDYVTNGYDLLPEDQVNDFFQQRLFKIEEELNKKESLRTTERVYIELICQRLQQGFQLILQPKAEMLNSLDEQTLDKCMYILSIGRIYHELLLRESKITITYYHPRHPYNAKNIKYCYRIRTPDNETYGVSWVEFTGEKLETYKWNYLDNYICLRADSDYQVIESLKYWRFRLLVLPTMHRITKVIIEKYAQCEERYDCDLYHVFTHKEKRKHLNDFLKLLEIFNRMKRSSRPSGSNNRASMNQHLNRRSSYTQINTPGMRKVEAPNYHSRYSQPTDSLLSTINEAHSRIEQISLKSDTLSFEFDDSMEKRPDHDSSKPQSIIEEMKKGDLYFFKVDDLPPQTFIGADAIKWAIDTYGPNFSETNAEVMFQNLQMNNFIVHASGDKNQPFKRGFYLYSIIDEKTLDYFSKHKMDIRTFERDWMEVGVVHQQNSKLYDTFYEDSSDFLSHNYKPENSEFTFKNMILELEAYKSGRVEWVNVKYHSLYDPDQAFEMIIEWMVATGNAIPEVVFAWNRNKNSDLHIVPIPWDPFALPFSSKSDPLRGPIFISLNVDCLSASSKTLDAERLFSFQEKILAKFGFIPFTDSSDNQRNFVHVSGSIFVMIPSKNPASSPSKNSNKRGKFLMPNDRELACSPHEEYITRHFSGMQQKGHDLHIDAKIGFLWCWNFMITKRFKTSITGDEHSMRKIMEDFKAFCSDENGRLFGFWEVFETWTGWKPEPAEEEFSQ